MRTVLPAAVAFGLAAALVCRPSPAAAQSRYQYVGPNECLNCHDHQDERQWYERQEIPEIQKRFPAKRDNAGHINSLKQLEAAKSNDFARAIGLRDKYDLNGACVKCHATIFRGDANAGVSCERCHGPASGYLKPHQTKGAYAQSVAVGLVDIVGKVQTWATQCATCHVMTDAKLIAAGHPSGDDFDFGQKVVPVSLHFKKKYDPAQINAIGNAVVRQALARRPGGAPPPVTMAASTSTPTTIPPAPPTSSSIPAATSSVPPAFTSTVPSGPGGTTRPPDRSNAGSEVPKPITPVASLSGSVAQLQGRLIEVLTDMLKRGATAPIRTATPQPTLAAYSGPDAALLQLQRDAIALALEALSTPPAAPAKPQPR